MMYHQATSLLQRDGAGPAGHPVRRLWLRGWQSAVRYLRAANHRLQHVHIYGADRAHHQVAVPDIGPVSSGQVAQRTRRQGAQRRRIRFRGCRRWRRR